ncbi:MAG: tryptophan synthase subunit alpha [Solirubrobacterales bacterium]
MESGTQTVGIAAAFRTDGARPKLMPYLMGGFPDLATSLRVGEAYAEAGADLVELGVPFSDPLADGPAIQAAGETALRAGATLERVLEQVARPLSQRLPVVLMCYLNPVLHRGLESAIADMAKHGVTGLIVPDLPAREAGDVRAMCDELGVALVPLVAPTTPPEEIDWIASRARGFVYVVSVTGVTGERAELPAGLGEVVARAKAAASVPVAVGFGVATAEQAAEVGKVADGVIVGSRLVRAIAGAADLDSGLAEVRDVLGSMAQALRDPGIG